MKLLYDNGSVIIKNESDGQVFAIPYSERKNYGSLDILSDKDGNITLRDSIGNLIYTSIPFSVTTPIELKTALESQGTASISLSGDITLVEPVSVNGKKDIIGVGVITTDSLFTVWVPSILTFTAGITFEIIPDTQGFLNGIINIQEDAVISDNNENKFWGLSGSGKYKIYPRATLTTYLYTIGNGGLSFNEGDISIQGNNITVNANVNVDNNTVMPSIGTLLIEPTKTLTIPESVTLTTSGIFNAVGAIVKGIGEESTLIMKRGSTFIGNTNGLTGASYTADTIFHWKEGMWKK